MSELRSLKKYSWLVSGFVALVIGVAGLSVQDFTWLPSRYQNYIVMIIGICGVIAKVFVENARVTRAEARVYEEFKDEALSDKDIEDCLDEYNDGLNPEYKEMMNDGRE